MYTFTSSIGFLLAGSHLSHNASPLQEAGLLIAANSTDAVHFSCSIVGEMRTGRSSRTTPAMSM
ncbi:hypothetical protein J6590_003559, partial [Homalodisca vitripennis]